MNSTFNMFLDTQSWINWLFPVILTWVAKPLLNKLLFRVKSVLRFYQLVELKKIYKLRRSEYQINFQIAKNSSYFGVFLCSCVLFFIVAITVSLLSLRPQFNIALWVYSLPIFMCEIVWLNQDAFTKKLIKYADKIKK